MRANPWVDLPFAPPYVLPGDQGAIARFNDRASALNRIQLEAVPVPFMGSPDAPVVLLNLNPGFDQDDVKWQETPEFSTAFRENLGHLSTGYPFFLLNPALQRHPGYKWWSDRLRQPISYVGQSKLAARLSCVEWFPYASKKFSSKAPALDSQQYGFDLVRRAMVRGSTIVVMRSRSLWESEIPELSNHSNVFALSNPQSPYISAGNCPVGFKQVLERLDG